MTYKFNTEFPDSRLIFSELFYDGMNKKVKENKTVKMYQSEK